MRRLLLPLFATIFATMFALTVATPGAVHAATFTVTTTTDAVDANPGDGVCDDGGGDCTLRAAVQEANAAPGVDTIALPPGTYTLTIGGDEEDDGLTGDLDISDDLTIQGASATETILNAAGVDRYFDAPSVTDAVTITLRNLTIENGVARAGGGIRVSLGSLTIEDSTLTDNTAADGNGGAVHIQNGTTLTVSGSLISRNAANNNGAGGGINSGVETTITETTISNNTARLGGGVQVADATFTADAILATGNSASDTGGGLQVFRSEMHLSNSTISGNAASGPSKGAGVHVSSGLSTLRYVTITGNSDGFGLSGPFEDALLESVIIANNPTGDCDSRVRVQSVGANLDSDGTCGFTITANPNIASLADNGGPTLTHALLPGSAAIDASVGCIASDQRGVARPLGSGCDLGAFEAEPAAAPPVLPTRTLTLPAGFVLLGWTGPDMPIADAIADISSAVTRVFTWDLDIEAFLTFGPSDPAFVNTLTTLRYGDGFWILLNRDVSWDMPVFTPG